MLLAGIVLVIHASGIDTPPHQQQYHTGAANAAQESTNDTPEKVVATYTEVLAWFTGFLALFTVVLAGASIWQGILTKRSVDLARQEFITSHRPRLSIRLLVHKPFVVGEPVVIAFSISNGGDSPARRVGYDLSLRMPRIGNMNEMRWNGSGNGHFDSIAPGAFAHVTHTTGLIWPNNETMSVAGGNLVVGGLIGYLDDNGVCRLTAFQRVKVGRGEKFRHMDPIDPDFEYEG